MKAAKRGKLGLELRGLDFGAMLDLTRDQTWAGDIHRLIGPSKVGRTYMLYVEFTSRVARNRAHREVGT